MEKFQEGQFVSKIDLADAYLQVELDDNAKLCIIYGSINYTKCVFRKLPATSQQLMETLNSDLPGGACYLDDLIVNNTT